jgi:hypothetical protein
MRCAATIIFLMNFCDISLLKLLVLASTETEKNMSIKPYKMIKLSDDNLLQIKE